MGTDELIINSLNSITVTIWAAIVVGLIVTLIFTLVALYIFKRINALVSVLTPEQRKYYRSLTVNKHKQLRTIDIPKVEPIGWETRGPGRRHDSRRG